MAVAVSIARGHDACYPFTAVGAADGATITDERRTDYYLSAAEQAGESAGSWVGDGDTALGFHDRDTVQRQGCAALLPGWQHSSRHAEVEMLRDLARTVRHAVLIRRHARGRAETHAQVSRGCQGGARRTANSRTRKKPPPWLRAGRMREGTFGVDLREAGARHC